MNVALIGAGNIGQRYLQAMLKEGFDYDIYVVDPSQSSLEKAREAISSSLKNVEFLNDIEALPETIDCAAVTTTSMVRKEIIQRLMEQKTVRNLILEKFLFPYEGDYKEIKQVLDEKECKSWVNCTRRAQNSYKKLKEIISDYESMQIVVSGSKWGLGCNSIHFLDLISYMADNTELELKIDGLKNKIIDSKRDGYKEIVGTIKGAVGKCSHFSITCYEEGESPLTVYISTEQKRILIDEAHQTLSILNKDGKWEAQEFKLAYTSQIMDKVIKDIIDKGNCDLATYEESMKIHLALQTKLTAFFEAQGIDKGLCPIT